MDRERRSVDENFRTPDDDDFPPLSRRVVFVIVTLIALLIFAAGFLVGRRS